MALQAPEVGVGAVLVEELSVRARLNNGAVRHDDYLGCMLDGGKPVRHNEGGSSPHQTNKRFLDVMFALRIER